MAQLRGDTFTPIELPVAEWENLNYEKFVVALRTTLADLTKERLSFYRTRHKTKAGWANWARVAMVVAGAAGVICTALASVASFAEIDNPGSRADLLFILLALLSYSLLGVLALIDKGLEGSGSYFRAIASIMAIRDLWTAYQFDDLAASVDKPADPAAQAAARAVQIDRARVYCAALEAISLKEVGEWKTAYETAVQSLAATGTAGVDAMTARFDAAIIAFKTEAAKRAQDGAQAAKDATPAAINISVDTGGTKGIVKIWIDGQPRAEGDQRSFAITGLSRSAHVMKVMLSGDGISRVFERVIEVKADVSDLTVELK